MPISVLLLIVLLNMTAFRGSKVVITLFAVDLGMPQFYIGALVAMYSVFPMFLGLYAGKLTDRLGVRAPMIGGTVGVVAGLLVPFIFPRVPALYASAMLIGATWVFYNVCAQNLIGILSDAESRARNFSNYGLVMAGGGFFGPLLSGFSIDHFGHAQTYLHLALIPVTSALVLVAMRSIPPGLGKGKVSEEHAEYSARLLSNKPLRRTLITSAIVLTGTDLFQFYMPIYGRAVGLSASAIGMILGSFSVAAFLVRLVMPRMVTRWGADTVLVWALFIGGAAYVLFPAFEHAALLAAVALVLGLGLGCSQPVSLMLIYDRAPQGRSGEALGLRVTINNFMHITIPLVFGAIGTIFGSAVPVFLANAAIMTVGGVLSRKAASWPRR
ncbi:MAG TPA: MFS transporter [Burkholderiales bacterium]|nr:MFS transporter [Burkholderiales bacterium]